MEKDKIANFFLILLLALLIPTTHEAIPELSLTVKATKILNNDSTGAPESQMFMKVTVSPDGTRATFSKRVNSVEPKDTKPNFRVFNIRNLRFENEIEGPELSEGTAITQMVSSSQIIALTIKGDNSGSVMRFDITGSTVKKVHTDLSITRSQLSGVSIKLSAELGLIHFFSGFIFFSTSDMRILKQGTRQQLGFDEEVRAVQLNPEISSTHFAVSGGSTHISLFDYSRMKPDTNDLPGNKILDAKLNEKKANWAPSDASYSQIEFNHMKTDKLFLTFVPKNSKAGNLITISESDVTVLGYIDTTKGGLTEILTGGVTDQPRNIIGTDFFFAVYVCPCFDTLNIVNKIVLVDTSSISVVGSIEYKIITDKIVPTEINQVIPTSMDRISVKDRTWMFSGATDVAGGEKAWARIIQLDQPFGLKCHEDCLTCHTEFNMDNSNCVKCANGNQILGPSGCSCSENCTSCNENDAPNRCKSCKEGYYLKPETGVEGEGSCRSVKELNSEIERLKTSNSDLEKQVKEIKIVIGKDVTDLIEKLPVTDLNGKKIIGCISAAEDGLCKVCMEGTVKNAVKTTDNADSCLPCGVSGCRECKLLQDEKTVQCVKCSGDMKLTQDDKGVQSCFKQLLSFWIGFFIFLWVN